MGDGVAAATGRGGAVENDAAEEDGALLRLEPRDAEGGRGCKNELDEAPALPRFEPVTKECAEEAAAAAAAVALNCRSYLRSS